MQKPANNMTGVATGGGGKGPSQVVGAGTATKAAVAKGQNDKKGKNEDL